MPMTRIAELIGSGLPTATGLVNRMVERGLVRREHDTRDRRVVLVSLTEEGAAEVRELHEARQRRMADRHRPAFRPRAGQPAGRHPISALRAGANQPRRRIPVTAAAQTATPGAGRHLCHRPPRPLRDPGRGHAGPVPGRPRPDHRRDGHAAHPHRPARHPALHLGGHRLPADQHGQRTAVREAVRPVRAAADADDRHQPLPVRLAPVCAVAGDVAADPVPRHPGPRRRGAVPDQPGRHR